MREISQGYQDEDYKPEIELEIGGQPIWYSSCDHTLLVYSGKCMLQPHNQSF